MLMKRREFIAKGAAGALGMMLAGCSSKNSPEQQVELYKELTPFSTDVTVPKPSGGTMPMGEIGKTGIKVSKFGFGSHMRKDIVQFFDERQKMIREAYDLGVRLFDVYDKEQECFQYEPMGKHLAPMIKDVVISIAIQPYDGRNFEKEFERDLKMFGRDYIDMVRIHAYTKDHADWPFWEKLFRYKEKGYIRAVGVPIHDPEHLDVLLDTYPLDYVIFPYNFYHNLCWLEERPDEFDYLPEKLRKRGIGVVSMKAFAGDYLIIPFKKIAQNYPEYKDVSFPQAALRHVINSGMNPDATLTGMFTLSHVYENVVAFYNPKMSDEEKGLLSKLKSVAKISAQAWLPDHYKWLANWAPKDRV
jgi:predicted aldo/keto reductase-like oxidoreductase